MDVQRDNRVGKSRLSDTEGGVLVVGFVMYAIAEIISNGWAGVVSTIGLLFVISALS